MSLNQVTHVIFDWDGTLMDSAAKIVSCMQKAAELSRLPVPTIAQVEHIIGISLVPAIERLFNIKTEQANLVSDHYKRAFLVQDQTPCLLFDGAEKVLNRLSARYTLGVATGKARRGLTRAFEHSSTGHYFDSTICGDEAMSKPSPDMLKQLLSRWQIQPHQAIMIGDTTYDMEMAKQIDMPRIGVSYGVHHKKHLQQHNPICIIDDLSELSSWL